MNRGTALTLAFGVFLAGGLLLTSGLRNRSLSEVVLGQTSVLAEEAQAASGAAPTATGAGGKPPAPRAAGGSNAPFMNVSGSASAQSGGTGAEKALVSGISKAQGWDAHAWETIIELESGWNPKARNPSSGAYGIGQFLGSTKTAYSKYGSESPEARRQIEAMAVYIKKRYGTPTAALAFHRANGWY